MANAKDEILTLDDVVAYLKAGKRTVYRLAASKKIPAFKV
ncbi:helix-turn-helix transcriptional regulator, partial [Klebsiella pneumoniae]